MALVIVDDSTTNLVVLKSLSAKVYKDELKTFLSSREAANWLIENKADVIIVDYSMPHLNGIDFIRAVRESPLHQSTAILMVTGSNERHVRLRALEAGASDFLSKPVDALEFKSMVAGYVSDGLSQKDAPALA